MKLLSLIVVGALLTSCGDSRRNRSRECLKGYEDHGWTTWSMHNNQAPQTSSLYKLQERTCTNCGLYAAEWHR